MMWFGTNYGVSCFDSTAWNSYTEEDGLVSNLIRTITVDQNNVVWFGTPAGVSRFDGNSWTAYTENEGLISRYVYASAVDYNNVKWFGTDDGVSSFDSTIWTTYTEEDGLVYNQINEIAVDHDNFKWFATDKGASCFDGTRWRTFTEQNGLPSNIVHSIAVDSNNIVWLYTNEGEIQIENFEVAVNESDFLPEALTSLNNFPNPFNPSTTITYSIGKPGLVTLDVYNILGQKVTTLFNGYKDAGNYSVRWNASGQVNGIYLTIMKAGGIVKTEKMLMLK